MKLNNWKNIMVGLAAIVAFTACVGDLDVDPSKNPQLSTTFDQGMVFNKVYANLGLTGQTGPSGTADIDAGDEGTSGFVRLVWNMQELPSDLAICSWGDGGITTLNFNTWGASHEFVRYLYYRLNFGVTMANWFLQNTSDGVNDSTDLQRAEVRFLRALDYYYLMDFFGNPPFTTEVNTSSNPPQIQRDSLFRFIEAELLDIEDKLASPLTNTYGRVDKTAAQLLLSRLYLNAEVYTGTARWSDARSYAQKVMNSGYTLAPTYRHLFMADNGGTVDGSSVNTARQEVILPILQDGEDTKSYAGSTFLIASTYHTDMNASGTTEKWSGNRARPELVKLFFSDGNIPEGDETTLPTSANDARALFFSKDRTVDIENTGTFTQGISVAKWTNVRADGGTTSSTQFCDTDVPFMRVAEAYLNFAEASMRLAGGSTQEAKTAIDAIRNRAGAAVQTSYDLADVLDERGREFYFEGYRRTDLIRFGYFGGYSSTYTWQWKGGSYAGANFAAYRNLYPIPTNDLTVNGNLVQNTGY